MIIDFSVSVEGKSTEIPKFRWWRGALAPDPVETCAHSEWALAGGDNLCIRRHLYAWDESTFDEGGIFRINLIDA